MLIIMCRALNNQEIKKLNPGMAGFMALGGYVPGTLLLGVFTPSDNFVAK